MTVTSHRAGGWLAVVGAAAWALVDLAEAADVEALAGAIDAGDLSKALDAVTASGVSSAPDFAMAAAVDGQVRYLVRGAGSVVVRTGDSSQTIVGYVSPTWVDAYASPGATELSLSAPTSGAIAGPISGLARAGELTVRLVGERHSMLEQTAAAPVAEAATQGTEDGAYESMLYELLTENTTTRDALAQALVAPPAEPVLEEPEPADEPSAPAPVATATDDAVRGETATWQSTWQPLAPAESSVAETEAPPTPTPTPAEPIGIIDSLPWAAPAVEPSVSVPAPSAPESVQPVAAPVFFPNPTPAVPAPPMDPDVTRVRAAFLQHLSDPAPTGPAVWAVVCPHRHWTPPYAPHCRVCGAPVAEQQPQQISRPVLGRLLVSTGAVVSLDRGVIFGRAPVSAAEGADRPHLIKLDGSEVSRRHVEVRVDDWQVLVRDLGSGNGTTLTLPGRPAERLRPNEDYALEPGSMVGVADLVTVTYEVLG